MAFDPQQSSHQQQFGLPSASSLLAEESASAFMAKVYRWMVGGIVVTARVVCALHYPTDLVGGLLVGGACAVVGFAAASRAGLFQRSGTRP